MKIAVRIPYRWEPVTIDLDDLGKKMQENKDFAFTIIHAYKKENRK